MATEEAREDLNGTVNNTVDNRVSRLEGAYEHLATKADLQKQKAS